MRPARNMRPGVGLLVCGLLTACGGGGGEDDGLPDGPVCDRDAELVVESVEAEDTNADVCPGLSTEVFDSVSADADADSSADGGASDDGSACLPEYYVDSGKCELVFLCDLSRGASLAAEVRVEGKEVTGDVEIEGSETCRYTLEGVLR